MNSMFDAVMEDARTNVVLLYNQTPGIIIAACAGTLSTISSLTIMFLIVFRSRDALGRVYHRIMFGMSAADVLMSTAIAVTTLAMPRDSIYGQFEGLMLGNQATCNIQGFLFTFGSLCTSMYNTSLMVYFYLSIHNRMNDANISRCIEPFFHIASVGYGLVLGTAFLVFELYNPTPFVPWCTIIMYPWWCTGPGGTDESAENCLLRGNEKGFALRGVLGISFVFILVVVLYSLINIVWTIYSQEKLLVISVRQTNYYIAANNKIAQDLRYTKVIFKQSLLYVCAYLLVNVFPVLSLCGSSLRFQPWFQVMQLTLRPLQGFFNLIIFLNHKVYNARRSSSNLSIYDALRKVFASKGEPEHIISTLMLVRNYQEHENNEEFLPIQVVDLIDGKILDFDDNIEENRGNQKDDVGSDHGDNLSPPFGGSRIPAGGSNDLSGFDDVFSDNEGISYNSSHLSSKHKSQDGASRPSRDDSKLSYEISTDE